MYGVNNINTKNIIYETEHSIIYSGSAAIGGLVLLFCGVYIAPRGEIHESILVGFGEVATFSGGLMGIDYVYKKRS